ncbi:unnamed protein product [Kuraishia capsulata CBS 1993]|uniref:Zn(2)-C6 fungal-type domain-containing protein n=1 Tax=Kuraishia capsulata CBS 1993 TaxID=1382522 RepID=W6MUT9_9ASCO|nr:uncharacterized protein KUCA_T00005524001 [Kuraishia capsulata CBS 1993]CDK29532.1 unnamed protein product [Kuraishia capsulata CBS 1993]
MASLEQRPLDEGISLEDSAIVSPSGSLLLYADGEAKKNRKHDSKRTKRMACVECRQQKSKCDAQVRAPEACTRCTKKRLHCSMDTEYKRTVKRDRVAQMEKEFLALRKSLEEAGAQGLIAKHMPGVDTVLANQRPSASPPQQAHQPVSQPTLFLPPIRSALQMDNRTMSPSILLSHNKSLTPPIASLNNSRDNSVSAARDEHSHFKRPYDSSTVIDSGPSVSRNEDTAFYFGSQIPGPSVVPRMECSDEMCACEPKTLGEVSLNSQQIAALYREFVMNYHPMLPVVDVLKGIERLFKLCPVLFWTIMFTSSRRHHSETISKEESHDLYTRLSPILKSALAELTISPITRYAPTELDEPILNVSSVYSVQAFLLYSFWPPLTSSLSADTSWNTVGIAVYQAIRIGLHLPGHSSDGIKTSNLDLLAEQMRTWIACNIVSQTVATTFGFPGFTQFDGTVSVSRRTGMGSDIPQALKQMVAIQHFEDQAAKTLNSNPLDPLMLSSASDKLSLLQVLSRELDQLELSFASGDMDPMDDARRFSLLAARLHLSTYHFLDTAKVATFELERGLVVAYNAALALISHCNNAQMRDKKFIKYLPGVYVVTLWQATCIIAKLIHSPFGRVLDIGGGKELFQAAVDLMMKASVIKHDMAYRSSGIMRSMWALFKALNDAGRISGNGVVVRSRMSASVFFDCLWVLREQSGMIKLMPKRLHKQSVTTDMNGESVVVVDEEGESSKETSNDPESEFGDYSSEEGGSVIEGDDPEQISPENKSSKSTPTSIPSMGSSQRRKTRTLSATIHPESSARKIIKTIPLDPRPISITSPTSTFLQQVVNPSKSPESEKSKRSPNFQQANRARAKRRHADMETSSIKSPIMMAKGLQAGTPGSSLTNGSPVSEPQPLDSWDVVENWDSDVLWRDIDSVMNDFGFHADDTTRHSSGIETPIHPNIVKK